MTFGALAALSARYCGTTGRPRLHHDQPSEARKRAGRDRDCAPNVRCLAFPRGSAVCARSQEDGREAKIDGLVAQAKAQDQGIGCKLDDQTWNRIKAQFAKAAGLPATSTTTGDGYGCVTMLLSNVQQNLTTLENIHKHPAASSAQSSMACFEAP